MQSPKVKNELLNPTDSNFLAENNQAADQERLEQLPFEFKTSFMGNMEIYSESQRFAEYLDDHEVWFYKCAQPMKVEPLHKNGYVLTVGRFGAFGYEVEPKMGVILHPSSNGVYPMESIPVPGYTPPGYEVDYKASMILNEVPASVASSDLKAAFRHNSKQPIPQVITQVTWQLNLAVKVRFPKFIYKLSSSLIQTTGDRLLSQIVRQISPNLTYKVQKDFHSKFDLPVPSKNGRSMQKIE